jgi:hypothetical protein
MGYTRYYTIKNNLDETKFKEYSKICKEVCEYLQKEYDYNLVNYEGVEGTQPEFTDKLISFNGEEDLSHESFSISTMGSGFDFTKTARKPYDSSVLACLYLAKKIFKDSIDISSDGENDDEEIIPLVELFIRDKKLETVLN